MFPSQTAVNPVNPRIADGFGLGQLNARIYGCPIAIEQHDDGGDPAKARSLSLEIAGRDDTLLVVGHMRSTTTIATDKMQARSAADLAILSGARSFWVVEDTPNPVDARGLALEFIRSVHEAERSVVLWSECRRLRPLRPGRPKTRGQARRPCRRAFRRPPRG